MEQYSLNALLISISLMYVFKILLDFLFNYGWSCRGLWGNDGPLMLNN